MALTLNGWTAIESVTDPNLAVGKVPGTIKTIRLHKAVLPVFLAFLADVNKTVIPLNPGPLDGWEFRAARMAPAFYSCHASGTASDMRYDVWLADHKRHCTTAQIAQMHKLLDKYRTSTGKRVFGWGGDWTVGSYCDEMHLEAIQSWEPGALGKNATAADFANVQKRLGIKADGTISIIAKIITTVKPAPVPAKIVIFSQLKLGAKNASVLVLQTALKKVGLNPGPLDGIFGTQTRNAYASWQFKLGYRGNLANGIPGLTTLVALGKKAGFVVK